MGEIEAGREQTVTVARFALSAPRGFNLLVTARSHGWYDLEPFHLDVERGRLERVLLVSGRAVDVAISQAAAEVVVEVDGPVEPAVAAQVRGMLQLDEDLTPFYALTEAHPRLAYARRRGAGRLLRAPTVFEDVIKMLLTTNCTWANTSQMVRRLLAGLGEVAPSGRRAFPTPEAMASAGERFFREGVRAGYRASHLADIARRTASGELALEFFRGSDDPAPELRRKLLELPGIGPYAADNLLRLLGRYDYLGLDSWCRGKLKQLYPRARVTDVSVARRYQSFAPYQGLILWLDLTRDWHEPAAPEAPPAARRAAARPKGRLRASKGTRRTRR